MANTLERYADLHPRTVDALTAVALYACVQFGVSISTDGNPAPDDNAPKLFVTVLAVALSLAVAGCRRWPRGVLLVTAAGAMTLFGLEYLPSPMLLAPVMAALYWIAALTDHRTSRTYAWTTTGALAVTGVAVDPTWNLFLLKTVGTGLWLMFPVAIGSRSRLRRAYLESVQARAAHAERTREEEARLRVTEERMRIARELHDVVAHHMAVANAQAGTAAHLARTHPEQAQKILAELAGTTSSALLELRATVGILRSPDDPDPLEPTPGLDRLPDLIAGCRSAGLDVTVVVEGDPQPLLPGVDLTAYRIIQEALTNVTKHGHGHGAEIRLAYRRSRLLITVTNEGTAPEPPGSGGFGLMGMRERAHSVGGDLHAGPRPEGGFQVTTALPLHHRTHPEAPEAPEAFEDKAPL
ncbi:sensor histidine kinase [Streptomyces acidiscabies]|uniref:sensor histidine kinase n=1 Tax=Streptomyces acidiscabies TaxID=42234 RepID=UPI000952C28E|nr:sensor histidine kinase [Streptomyces acidiscabies]